MVYTINNEQLTRRILCTIDGSKVTTETAIPLMLRLNLPDVKVAGADVRLAKLDGTPIAREIEWKWANDDVALHFPFDTVAGVDSQFYVYWENPNLAEPAANSTYGSQAVWDSHYLEVYHMNQDPSNGVDAIKDSTSNVNHGTSYGVMTTNDLIDDNYGKAIAFDGNDDYILSKNNWGLFSNTDRTIIIKSQSDTPALTAMLSSKLIGLNYMKAYSIFPNADNWRATAAGTGYDFTTSVVFDTNTNIHTITHTPNISRYYLNGVNIGSHGMTIDTYNLQAVIGGHGWNNVINYKWSGSISEIMICDSLRSVNYISTISNNLNNPTATGTDPFYKSIGNSQHQRRTPQFIN